jgi:type I restriction enzyme S subunit
MSMKTLLPEKWRWVSLGTILRRQRDLLNPSNYPDKPFNSLGLEDIGGGGTGEVTVKQVAGVELASAKAQFANGDLLYGRLRPYLNKVAIAPCDGVSSTEIWVLQPTPFIETQFAFFMLTSFYMLRRVERVTEGANLPRVDADGFDRIEIPLPPLSEQRRIVEILNEARDVRRLRQQADHLTTQLIPSIFNEMFAGEGGYRHWPEVAIKRVVHSADYGTSTAANENGVGVPCLRMNNVTYEGELDLDDLKHVELSESELRKQLLRKNDVLFNRTNSLELVGKTGLWDASFEAVAASYFVRLRLDLEQVDPRYMVAFLNLASTKRRLQNMAKQAIGMSNINANELQRVRMPLPDIELQRKFGKRIESIREYRVLVSHGVDVEHRLTQPLLAYAFSGELTAEWREANRIRLALEAESRDQWLRENGIKQTLPDVSFGDTLKEIDGRHEELNREQRKLLKQIEGLDCNENGGVFTLASLVSTLEEPLERLPPDAVRRHLDVLAARGLIKAISRRAGEGGSVSFAFGNIYRRPIKEDSVISMSDEPDFQKLSELDRLLKQENSQYVSDRLRAGNLAPRSGMYQEIGKNGELGETVAIDEGKSLPPPTLDGGVYEWMGGA